MAWSSTSMSARIRAAQGNCRDPGVNRRQILRATEPNSRLKVVKPRLCSGDAVHRVAATRELCGDSRALRMELDRREYPSQVRDAFDPRGTSRQRNTHSIESREVLYPWHPWHNRVVAVHQSFTRNGHVLFRCSIQENLEARLLEIPQWMFDPATCGRMRLAAVPIVSCKALLNLKSLLQCALLPGSEAVLQAQHSCLLSPGGADAKVTEGRSTQTVSSTPPGSGLAGAASRNQAENREVVRATAARTLRKDSRRGQQKGDGGR
jgi:hypothetical protein